MTIELASDDIRVDIDAGRGADILALVDKRTGVDVLFRTPWRDRADAIRAGQAPSTTNPTAGWLEGYRGGWQTLCPVAGDPAIVHGAPVTFHGEASIVPWTVDASGADTVRLHVDLFSVPLRIERIVALKGPRLAVTDTLINLSPVDLRVDYVQHPAFGGPFLEGECVLDTGARMFVNDPAHDPLFAAGQVIAWPMATALDGTQIDLREIPSRGESRELFGWLEDFVEPWASITNRDIGLSVRVEWDGEHLPYAWLWQELESTPTFPWYRRARAVAIEPASVPTGGVDRSSVVVVPASGRRRIGMSITLDHHPPGGTNA